MKTLKEKVKPQKVVLLKHLETNLINIFTIFDDASEYGSFIRSGTVPPVVLELILTLFDCHAGSFAHKFHHASVLHSKNLLVPRQ